MLPNTFGMIPNGQVDNILMSFWQQYIHFQQLIIYFHCSFHVEYDDNFLVGNKPNQYTYCGSINHTYKAQYLSGFGLQLTACLDSQAQHAERM